MGTFPHKLTKAERVKGGATGKRGASIKKQIESVLSGDIPDVVLKVLRERKAILPNGKTVFAPVKPLDAHAARAVALVLLKNALLDEAWAVKILAEYMDGKPSSNDTLTIKAQSPAEIASADAKAKEVFEKHKIAERGQIVETTAKEVEAE